MGRIISKKIKKRDVPAFEKMLGFKTTGEIYVQGWDKKTQKKIDTLLENMYISDTPKSKNMKGE